ncbi:G-protein coupled receptor 54-like [Liolophura sinensis]|uniref:G-protein coupled receptor 54-like n=1 Tax=Liolophura sinensis TaxID=3198878 RepID=UPI0031581768
MDGNTTGMYLDFTYFTANSTNQSETIPFKVHSIVVPTVWAVLILVGVVGNGLVIFTLLKQGDRTATTYYIINLAIADFAFIAVVVPFTCTLYALPDWVFGEHMCKFINYMVYVTLHATCLTLTAMTIDRYFAIVHPLSSITRRTLKAALIANTLTWAASFCLSIPFAMNHGIVEKVWYGPRVWCHPVDNLAWKRGSILYVVIVTYLIPLTIILLCYSLMLRDMWKAETMGAALTENASSHRASLMLRSMQAKRRRKVAKMVAVVVLLFATFWMPIHVLNLCFAFAPDFPATNELYDFKVFAHTLSYANSCVNPIVYAFMGDGFRRALRKTFSNLLGMNRVVSVTLGTRATGSMECDPRVTRSLLTDDNGEVSRRSSGLLIRSGSVGNSHDHIPRAVSQSRV